MKPKYVVLNDSGEPITFNEHEKRIINYNQKIANDLGYQIDITTLTGVISKVTTQKFYDVPFADYLPVRVGQGAWSQFLMTYRSFELGGAFEDGIVNTASNDARLASADAGVDSITVAVKNWAKTISWTKFDLELASRSGNWDLISSKEAARVKNWQLGIQKVAFLGLTGDASVLGLLNQASVENNTSFITKQIKDMTSAELTTFLKGILGLYRANANYTAMPTHFVIPESDYLGLAAPSDSSFPLKSKLALMLETFVTMTQNPNFKILPSAYANNFGGDADVYRYALYNYNDESLRMDLPVDYTNTIANTLQGVQFQSGAYGQFTGAMAYRPKEMLYFTYNATP